MGDSSKACRLRDYCLRLFHGFWQLPPTSGRINCVLSLTFAAIPLIFTLVVDFFINVHFDRL